MPSNLERLILDAISNAHRLGLTERLDQLRVKLRENTGAGRYVYFDNDSAPEVLAKDGDYDGGGAMIECPDVPNGLAFILSVEGGKPQMLEIATYGNVSWSGEEEGCRVI